ncbi:MAG: 23S rRNA (adenine(2503)-C(2))-methyltransferase RlmN, partial [Bacteroidaceae bacterium]|nr:23S rRNA (adenine(2503)-C(2))-methyltransferase RlmN [Bacteroidaceae bacterium]
MTQTKDTLLGKDLDAMRQVAAEMGMPRYAAGQLMRWVYAGRATEIDEMTNVSKAMREQLAERYTVGRRAPVMAQRSADGTVKYLFPTGDGQAVETVFIPDDERGTLCVSCQVGCKMGCAFCMTGRQGFHGHLTVCDIMNQVLSCPEFERLTNIVFMGQGEPFDNLDAVLAATRLLTDKDALAWSPRRITVSTVGLPRGLERFCEESECHLAISLHHPDHEGRMAMMPAERAMPVADIVETLRRYDWAHQRRLTFEYIVFGGLNNLPATQRQLAQLLRGLPCRVNLIRFHTIPDTPFHSAT